MPRLTFRSACLFAALLLAACAQTPPQDAPVSLAGTFWQFVKFQGGDDRTALPDDRAKYTVAFGTDGGVSVRSDFQLPRHVPTRLLARPIRRALVLRSFVRPQERPPLPVADGGRRHLRVRACGAAVGGPWPFSGHTLDCDKGGLTMKRLLLAVAIAIPAFLMGCASVMREAPSQTITPPAPEKAKIVFMRSSMVAGAIGCDLFEVVNGELRYIGQLPTGNKVAYETTPGDKVFMAYGTAADFMLAKVVAGRTYYSIVRPNWGTGGFAPTPIRQVDTINPDQRSKEFQEWTTGTKLIEPTDGTQAWFAENKSRMQAIYTDYWSRFQRKNEQEKAERTLLPQDGR
jgi:hypothetical protein